MAEKNELPMLSASTERGSLGVMHLKRYWDKSLLEKSGRLPKEDLLAEWNIDITMLGVLGLGLEQAIKELYSFKGDFYSFEQWILAVNKGKLIKKKVDEFNTYILSRDLPLIDDTVIPGILTEDEMRFWDEKGYVILRGAIPAADAEEAIEAICDFIKIKRHDPSTWYLPSPHRQGIMVQLFQHPALEKNRQSPRIRAAYEQLWRRKDLWLNTDRAGFNPPQTSNWLFPGPHLHWDVSLELPIPFGLQGILYLSDTAVDQGAFTLVPGFQNRIEEWLHSIPPGINPRTQDIHALGSAPIAANAGDFILWHQALPHGSSANTSTLPRFVQYLNYAPLDAEVTLKWK